MKSNRRLLLCAAAAALATCLCVYCGALLRTTPSAPESLLQTLFAQQDHYARWFRSGSSKKPVAVALVVHGLNVRPDMMEPVIAVLNSAGIEALNVSLKGHGSNFIRWGGQPADSKRDRLETFKRISYFLWINEVHQAYLQVMLRARKLGVPVYFAGYSLGGLLGCDLLTAKPGVHFQAMVLFAPAIALHPAIGYHLKPLKPFPEFVIDSDAPENQRANDGTPMAGYTALFDAITDFEKNLGQRLNVPTLVFMDAQDEFVSFEMLQKIVRENGLDRWELVAITKDNTTDTAIARHMIINEQSMGPAAWAEMVRKIKAHLTPGSTALKAASGIRQLPNGP
jgi:esterase/lipase